VRKKITGEGACATKAFACDYYEVSIATLDFEQPAMRKDEHEGHKGRKAKVTENVLAR
jgi:hypothetical protein